MRSKKRKLSGYEMCTQKKSITLVGELKERKLGRPELRWDNTKTDIKVLDGRE